LLAWFSSDLGVTVAFFVALAGLLVAVFGFRVTLQQIRQVKTATEASEAAIAGLKVRLSHFDVIQECATAESALAALRQIAREGDWADALGICDQLATSLINLKERYAGSDFAMKQQITEATDRVTRLSGRTVKDPTDSSPDPSKDMATLREIHAVLMKIRFQIQEEQ
jgi:hypothetical protein